MIASFRIAVRSAARLRRQVGAVFAVSTLAAASLAAQGNPQCDGLGSGLFGGAQERNICNAGVDGASVFVPVGGLLVAGGNPFLGATGGLGGFGHLGVTLRVNATRVVIPEFNYNGSSTVVGARQTV